jgi:hypothetical protein
MKADNDNKPIEVFSGTQWQAEMVRSLLENAAIDSFIEDGIMGTLGPWWTAPGGAGAVRVFVLESNYEMAKAIANEYDANLKVSE